MKGEEREVKKFNEILLKLEIKDPNTEAEQVKADITKKIAIWKTKLAKKTDN